MISIRRILFAPCLIAVTLGFGVTKASVTKVGNGDDGADLEVLAPITSGPIWKARQAAIETVRQLNVMGVPGLGLLIPELERTDLKMAAKDAHPTGEKAGSIEVSSDKQVVYARTFAEPYAATRFFPASAKLKSEQLVALHIHEALHRALPPSIRANEDAVMHITMAITSPGASYDRIQQVASLYVESRNVADLRMPSSELVAATPTPITLPKRTSTNIGYTLDVAAESRLEANPSLPTSKVHLLTSLGGYKTIAGTAVEPVFRARMIAWKSEKYEIGPTSYELAAKVHLDEQTLAGPLVRFTAKSLDDVDRINGDRDITSLGAFYEGDYDSSYFQSEATYSLPSSPNKVVTLNAITSYRSEYKSILSLAAHSGFKWGHFFMGGIAEVHASQGIDYSEFGGTSVEDGVATLPPSVSSFRLLVLGPELGYTTANFQFKLYGKWLMNEAKADLTDLGDLMDRGSDKGLIGSSLSVLF